MNGFHASGGDISGQMKEPGAAPDIAVLREDWADPGVGLPTYETDGAAGADVRANLPPEIRHAGLRLLPGERVLVPTGLRIAVPAGWEAQIRPRSGLALKHGITLANAPGTIDADYRGPVGVILLNLGDATYKIAHGDRIAQMVIARAPQAAFTPVADLPETARGSGGFGSTGRT